LKGYSFSSTIRDLSIPAGQLYRNTSSTILSAGERAVLWVSAEDKIGTSSKSQINNLF